MKPGSLTSFASEDMNYINIKTEDDCEPPTPLKLVEADKPIKEVDKKQKEVQPITGPFECIQNRFCHLTFFSCCEYSTHYRDEHTRRAKGLRCQVCEKPLSLDVDEQRPYACKDEIPEGSSSEEIDAEALADSSQEMNAKYKHNGLVEASIEAHNLNMNDLRWQMLDLADQEDRRRRRRIEARRARLQARDVHFRDMTETQFVKAYRLNKAAVRRLVTLLTPFMPREKRNDAMSVTTKVLIALAFYATGSYQTIVGQSAAHNVSQPSVSLALRQVTKALNTPHIFRSQVQFPLTRVGRDRVKQGFYIKYKIPGLVGAIDGTHVRIIRPNVQEEQYFNRKGYHSLNVMIICDADLSILCVDPSHPGSTHDNIAWRTHPLHRYLNDKFETEQLSLLGDSGYALRKIMMTPPTNFLPGTPEAYFYDLHVTARNIVERCIGLLKARFRCLLSARMLHYDPVFAGQIVNACAVLHNMALRAQIPAPQLVLQERRREAINQVLRMAAEAELRVAQVPQNVDRRVNIELMQGRTVQQALIHRLWNERNM